MPHQLRIRHTAGTEALDIHRVGDHRDLFGGDAAGDDVPAQAFADGRHRVGTAQHMGFHSVGQAIAQAALGGGAVVGGGVLPEGAHLVDHRQAQAPPHPQGGDAVQHRGMGVQDIRLDDTGHLVQPPGQLFDDRQLIDHRPAYHTLPQRRGAVKVKAVHVLFRG